MSASRSARGSPGASGCAGCLNSVATGRKTRIVRPPVSLITRGRAPNVTSSVSTWPAMDRASSSGYRSPPPNRPASPNGVGATWTTRMLTIGLLTLGDPGRLTGGYLYHRRMAQVAEHHDARVVFGSFPTYPFPLPAVQATRVIRDIRVSGARVVLVD